MELHEVKIGDIVTYKDAFKRNIVGKVIHRHDGKQNAALANHINIQKLDGKPSYPTTIHVSKVNPFVPLQDKKGKKQSEAPMKVTKEETETISELNKKTMQAAYKERLEREHDSAGSIGSDETAHDVMPKSLKHANTFVVSLVLKLLVLQKRKLVFVYQKIQISHLQQKKQKYHTNSN